MKKILFIMIIAITSYNIVFAAYQSMCNVGNGLTSIDTCDNGINTVTVNNIWLNGQCCVDGYTGKAKCQDLDSDFTQFSYHSGVCVNWQ